MAETYVCLECGHGQESMNRPCENCGSPRVNTAGLWELKEAADSALQEASLSADAHTAAAVGHLREAFEHVVRHLERLSKERGAESTRERAVTYRRERLGAIKSGDTPVKLGLPARFVLHVVPAVGVDRAMHNTTARGHPEVGQPFRRAFGDSSVLLDRHDQRLASRGPLPPGILRQQHRAEARAELEHGPRPLTRQPPQQVIGRRHV